VPIAITMLLSECPDEMTMPNLPDPSHHPIQSETHQGISPSDVVSTVLAGVLCGILAVFMLALLQGGAVEWSHMPVREMIPDLIKRFYPF
jgi:hypothetical protein